ncbi:MAG: hypothetical protein ACQETH_00685 [Candidatus Rifleibacteriota bacterium]
MKNKFIYILLFVVLASVSVSFSQQANRPDAFIAIQNGKEILIDADHVLSESSGSQLTPVGYADGYVFPDRSFKKKKYPEAQQIFTGLYSSTKSEEKEAEIMPASFVKKLSDKKESEIKKEKSEKPEDSPTIAWIRKNQEFYHDPLLECGTGTERIWIKDIKKLNGLLPCQDCFHRNGQAPAFIKEESGGLDLATAGVLLDNAEFKDWAVKHLPIKKAVFLTTRKLMVYPKQPMSRKGLKEIAHEVAMAYRRHTWKVIEVLARNTQKDLADISSF